MELNSLKLTISNYNNELSKLVAFLKSKTEELLQTNNFDFANNLKNE